MHMPFDAEPTADHARRFATRQWHEDHADTFVKWLQSLDYHEQAWIESHGYTESVLDRFEEAHPEVKTW